MSDTIVIAELSKGKMSHTTNELVTAANKLGTSCTVIVPCLDSSVATDASKISGVTKVIAAKSDVFASYDAAAWAEAIDTVAPSGTMITSASAQSKDLAARIAARRSISVVQDVISIDGTTLSTPIYSGKAIQNVSINGDAVISVRATYSHHQTTTETVKCKSSTQLEMFQLQLKKWYNVLHRDSMSLRQT